MSTESMITAIAAPLAAALVKAGLGALEGRSREEVARDAIAALIAAIPRDELMTYLTEGGIARAELMADIAELSKFEDD